MEETLREAPPADGWREALAQTIDEQRRRVGERIAGQRQRLRDLEARIAAQLDEATHDLTKQQDHARQAAGSAESKAAALLAELKLREQAVAARDEQTQRQRRQIAQQLRAKKKDLAAEAELNRAAVAASDAGNDQKLQLRLSELQGKYDRLSEEFESRQRQRDEMTQRLAELKTQNESRQHELKQQHAALEQAQRRQHELEAERGRLQADLQKHLEEGRRQADASREDQARRTVEAHQQAAEVTRLASELERVRRESHEQIEHLRADQGKNKDAQVQSLHQQLDELRKKLAADEAARHELEKKLAGDEAARHELEKKLAGDEAAWQRTKQELEKALVAAKQNSGSSKADAAELAKLRDENKQLETWLAEAEAKAKQSGGGGDQETDDLRRRFEMAVQDVRELKTKNAELSDQLSKARQGGSAAPAAGGGGSDWESMKKRMLADMESDFDESDEAQKADKLSIEGTIKITDQVVADKDHEIQELKRLLESQAQQVGEVAVGAAAVAEMLNSDELVKQERESLKRLQDSLREQLKQAEVDISVERAKLARERSELDEKLRGLEAERANMPTGGDASGDKGKKAGGRKWLARLGLGENKEG